MCFEEWTGVVDFSGSTRTLWRKGCGGRGGYKRAWAGGSSPWNFNQRQLLAGVARSPYVRTFLEMPRRGRIQFCRPLARSAVPFSREPTWPRSNLVVVVVVVARRGSNRQVLSPDARRLILSPEAYPFPTFLLLLHCCCCCSFS